MKPEGLQPAPICSSQHEPFVISGQNIFQHYFGASWPAICSILLAGGLLQTHCNDNLFLAQEVSMNHRIILSILFLLLPLMLTTNPGRAATKRKKGVALKNEKKIDLNNDSYKRLISLPGIGPKRAKAILQLRKRRPFRRISQIVKIRGIGWKTYRRLKPYLTVRPRKAKKSVVKTEKK